MTPNELESNEEAALYELVARHFLACVSRDALGHETIVEININEELVCFFLILFRIRFTSLFHTLCHTSAPSHSVCGKSNSLVLTKG